MKKLSRIRISNYRHIEALDVVVNEHGAVATGGNERGKTTFLNALKCALAAQDIGPDAIRTGADRCEIMIDVDDLTVRRVIGPKKSSVSVSKGEITTAANVIASKQAYLTELFGGSVFDPLGFFLAKPKERRAKVMEALPVTTTLAELRTFAPDLPDGFDATGHGLEALERARKHFFDLRTEANRAEAAAKKASVEADAAAKTAAPDDGTTTTTSAAAFLAAAEAALATLSARARDCAAAEQRTHATRERIAALRTDANAQWAQADGVATAEPTGELQEAIDTAAAVGAVEAQCAKAVADIEAHLAAVRAGFAAQLATAQARAQTARALYDSLKSSATAAQAAKDRATAIRAQADELSSAIGAVATPPTQAEIDAAAAAIAAERMAVAKAAAAEEGRKLRVRAAELRALLTAAQDVAEGLDTTVKALTDDAPAALLAKTNGIPGLTIVGDEILLDGIGIDHVSGAQQLDLAVEIARRANDKSKLLIVDGLERLDPEQMERFVKHATADGFQLIATRVTAGDLHIEAIAADDDEKEAAAE